MSPSSQLPPVPPPPDDWPPRRQPDPAEIPVLQLVIRQRRLCEELYELASELDRRFREAGDES